MEGEEFFNYLKRKYPKETYFRLFDYIKKISEKQDEDQPFYVLDLADVLLKIQIWKEFFPNVKPYYAVKTNADPVLIKLLVLLGFGFDCATKGEIAFVLKHGGSPNSIVFAHTIKPTSSIRYAAEMGVDLITFDCDQELMKIEKHYPNAKLLLRIAPKSTTGSVNLSIKYGCPCSEAEEVLKQAKTLKLNVVGLCFHIGALCEDPSSFTKCIGECRTIFDQARSLGFDFHILDIGAGFFGSTQKMPFFETVAREVREALDTFFPDKTAVQVIAEPGTYFAASAQKTISCIIGRKLKSSKNHGTMNGGKEIHYYLNDNGSCGSFFCDHWRAYDMAFKPLLETEELRKRPVYESKMYGQTLIPDEPIEECRMPEMHADEWIVWENMGAYATTEWTTYMKTSIPIPKYIFIKNTSLDLAWIENFDVISDFIGRRVAFIENGEY